MGLTDGDSSSRRRAKRDASSITRRNGCGVARRSRQARRPVIKLAAGIVAASMARRCQNNL